MTHDSVRDALEYAALLLEQLDAGGTLPDRLRQIAGMCDDLLAACEAASQELGRNAYLWETEAELYRDAPELAETRIRWARKAENVMKTIEAAIAAARGTR